MKNKVIQTVTGLIEISKLGITLMHEHLIINILFLWRKPIEANRLALAKAPVSL